MSRTSLLSALCVLGLCLAPATATAAATAGDGGKATNESRTAGPAPILEPSTLALVGLGLVGLAVFRTRYRSEER